MNSETGFGPEAAWPTAVTGCLPAKHGIYNWRCVRPGTDLRVRAPSATLRRPFWSAAASGGTRVLLADVRFTMPEGHADETAVLGWGERGSGRRVSSPPDLLDEINRRFGRYPRGLDVEHRGRVRVARRQLKQLERLTSTRTSVLSHLMDRAEWDLCIAGYYEPHYAGHTFHRFLTPGRWGFDEGRDAAVADGLFDVYRAFDRSLGDLIAAAGPDCNVLVFSGFGMRPNTNGLRVLDELLKQLGYWVPKPAAPTTRGRETARRLAMKAVPRPLARKARDLLMAEDAVDLHLEQIWAESTDWDRTRAFAENEPGHSYVRIARKAAPERNELCNEITAELQRLTNADTGRPAIARVMRREEIAKGPNVELLPDLVIEWAPDAMIARAHHPATGVIEEDLFELQRSEHTSEGFLIAAGPDVDGAGTVSSGHLLDLAPTTLRLLGAPIPRELDGEAIEELLAPGVAEVGHEDIDLRADPWAIR